MRCATVFTKKYCLDHLNSTWELWEQWILASNAWKDAVMKGVLKMKIHKKEKQKNQKRNPNQKERKENVALGVVDSW